MKTLKKGRDINKDVFRGTCKQCEESIELTRHEIGTSSTLSQWRCSNCQGWIDVQLQQPAPVSQDVELQVDEELKHLNEYLENWDTTPHTELERLEHSIIDLSIKGTDQTRFSSVAELQVAVLRKNFDSLSKTYQKYRTLYYELLYAVAQKYPNETRHQTALRYIKERESQVYPPASAGSDRH